MTLRPPALRLGLLTLLAAPPLAAQPPPGDAPPRVLLTALPGVHRVGGELAPGDTASITQWAVPVTASVPLASGVDLRVRTGLAASVGDGESVGGLVDTEVGLRAVREAGAGRAVVGLGLALPTGRSPSSAEVETAYLAGQGFFGFRAPAFGQGFRVAPSAAWAVPVTPRLAVGVGASYHVRGSFGLPAEAGPYDPGDEALVTVGADLRLQGGSTLGLELTGVRYGDDTWDDVRYEAGGALVLGAEWVGDLARTPVRLGASVRRRSGDTVPTATAEAAGLVAVVPTEIRATGTARFDLGPGAGVEVDLGGRHYAASRRFTAKTLVDLGVSPTVEWTEAVAAVGRVAVTVGDLRGVQAALGVSWTL